MAGDIVEIAVAVELYRAALTDGKVDPLQHVVCLRAAYVHDSCSIGGGLGNGHVRRSAPVVQRGHYGGSQGNAHGQQHKTPAGQQRSPHDGG